MPTTPLKCGSAPAGCIDSAAWRTSPLRKLSKGIGAIDSDRRLGVMHRIDSQVVFHSSTNLSQFSRIEQTRCPSCRLCSQMLCPSCVNATLRLAKIRDVNRELYLRKAEVCQKIDRELQEKMHFQSEMFEHDRSVRYLKQKIKEKKESIERLGRTLALTDVKVAKISKNVQTLESASIRHTKLIEEKTRFNQELAAKLLSTRGQNLCYNRFFSILFAHYFPLKKLELSTRKQRSSESMLESVSSTTTTTTKVWPPVKKYYFTINGCEINENGQYGSLGSELSAGSLLVLSNRARQSFAALLYGAQFLNVISFFLDFNLPYRLTLRELAIWNRWSAGLFATDMFHLNANVIALCAAFGLKNEVLVVNNPFNNLHLLIQEFEKYKIPVTRSLMTEQTKHKLILAFKEFNYEERQPEFNLEHIEDDWVSVDML